MFNWNPFYVKLTKHNECEIKDYDIRRSILFVSARLTAGESSEQLSRSSFRLPAMDEGCSGWARRHVWRRSDSRGAKVEGGSCQLDHPTKVTSGLSEAD